MVLDLDSKIFVVHVAIRKYNKNIFYLIKKAKIDVETLLFHEIFTII